MCMSGLQHVRSDLAVDRRRGEALGRHVPDLSLHDRCCLPAGRWAHSTKTKQRKAAAAVAAMTATIVRLLMAEEQRPREDTIRCLWGKEEGGDLPGCVSVHTYQRAL